MDPAARLLDVPCESPWKKLYWYFGWSAAPELRPCGEYVLCSAMDLRRFSSALPPLFRAATLAWGSLPTPRPTCHAAPASAAGSARPSIAFEALGAMPLSFNPAARAADHQPVVPQAPAPPPPAFSRTTDAALLGRQQASARALGACGLLLVRNILPYVNVQRQSPSAPLRARLDAARLRGDHPSSRAVVGLLMGVITAWPQHWLEAINTGRKRLLSGDWVCLRRPDGGEVVGCVVTAQRVRDGNCTIRIWATDRTRRLTETQDMLSYTPASGTLSRALVWLDAPQPPPERARWVNAMTPRKHVPPPSWRWAGLLGDARVDPTEWNCYTRPTLSLARTQRLDRVRNRDIYSALLSRLFDEVGDASAFPSAFRPAVNGQRAGHWRSLLSCAENAADGPEVRSLVHEVFTRSLTQALPLAARQTLWQLHACGLPVGPRTGGAGHCPIALAVDGTQTDEDHTQVALLSPIARSVWTQVLTGLRATQHFDLSFADAFMGGAQPSRDVRRFCLLGLQPVGAPVLAGPLRELLALLRGVVVHAIVSHRHGVGLALAEAGDDYQYDLTRSTAAVYEQCRSGVLRALVEERARHRLLVRQMRGAGLPAASCYGPNGPLSRWESTWLRPGVATVQGGVLRLELLPDRPPYPFVRDALMLRRRCPREDCAPPAVLAGQDFQQAFLASTEDGAAWGVAIVRGGDARADLTADLTHDLASPCLGLAAPSPLAAELTAALAALEAFASQAGARAAVPIMLRFSGDEAAALVAGTYDPPALGRLRAEVQRCLSAERRRRIVWLAGWRPLSRHVWGERSLALAQFARAEGCWGPVPAPLASARAASAPPAETCPVCFEDYDDPFPHTVDCSPAPRERWACALAVRAHRLCRACDAVTQASANPACPLCRAPRRAIFDGDF